MIGRRGVLTALVAAPAIIKVAGVMPIKPSLAPGLLTLDDYTHLEVGDMITIELDHEPLGLSKRPREFVITHVGDRSLRVVKEQKEGNTYMTINEITREAMHLWEQENAFIKYINHDWPADRGDVVRDLLDSPVPPVAAAALGAAAVLHKNPTLSRRRLFGGGS